MTTSRRGSYINVQLDSINGQLQGLFDDLGISSEERDKREKQVYEVIAGALEQHVAQVKTERDELRGRCTELQQNIKDMASALRDVDMNLVLGKMSQLAFIDVTPPFIQAERNLISVFSTLERIYVQRSDKANELLAQLTKLSDGMDGMSITRDLQPPSSKDDLDLSTSYLTQLEGEIQRWRNELQSRISRVSLLASQIVSFWAELGTPQETLDSTIMNCYKTHPERLGTNLADISRLDTLKESLLQEKTKRETTLSQLTKNIHVLWEKLAEDDHYMQEFSRTNRGLGLNVLQAHETEYARLLEKKRQNISVFIQDAREQIKDLWDKLYFSEEERYQFTAAYAEIYTDASLDAHECEIVRLEALLVERQPILSLIEQFNELKAEEMQLEASTQDASRLLGRGGGGRRDPTRLLREEKMRKRLAKRKPIVLQDLKRGLGAWEGQTDQPFLINGESFNDILEAELAKEGSKSVRKPLAAMAPPPARTSAPTPRSRPPSASKTPSRVNDSPTKSGSALQKHALPPSSTIKPPSSPTRMGPPGMTRPQTQISKFRTDDYQTPSRTRPTSSNVPSASKVNHNRCRSELGQYPTLGPDARARSVLGSRSPDLTSGIARLAEKANGHALPKYNIVPPSLDRKEPPRSQTSIGNYRPLSSSYTDSRQTRSIIPGTPSTSRTISTNSIMSENWNSIESEATSSEDEFDDPAYLKWRQDAATMMSNTPRAVMDMDIGAENRPLPSRKSRISEFNWEKDVF